MSAYTTYLNGGSLPPITTALFEAWPTVDKADAIKVGGPPPGPTTLAALADAVYSLEQAVVALQGA